MRKMNLAGLAMTGLLAAGVACAAPLKTRDVIDLWPNAIGPGAYSALIWTPIPRETGQ